MSQLPDDDELNLRKRRLESGAKSHMDVLIYWWLAPGVIGILGTLFIGSFLLPVFMNFGRNESLGRNINRVVGELNTDLAALVTLNWSQTQIWMYMLFGFILGVIIKYTYSDDKIR